MSTYHTLIHNTQAAASQAIGYEVIRFLPLPIETVVIVARIYGINALFFGPKDRIAGGANVDLNRWTCRTDKGNVKSISIG